MPNSLPTTPAGAVGGEGVAGIATGAMTISCEAISTREEDVLVFDSFLRQRTSEEHVDSVLDDSDGDDDGDYGDDVALLS